MSAVPLVNATLTQIAGGGSSEDYDSPAGADTARWSGTADAYVDEHMESQVTGQSLDAIDVTRLVVPLTPGSQAQRGDTVTYTYGGQTVSRTVQHMWQYWLFGTVAYFFFNR